MYRRSKPPAKSGLDLQAFLTRVATLGETDPDAAYKLWWEEGQLWDPWAKRALVGQL